MLPAVDKPREVILEEEEVIINTNIGSPSPLFVRTLTHQLTVYATGLLQPEPVTLLPDSG